MPATFSAANPADTLTNAIVEQQREREAEALDAYFALVKDAADGSKLVTPEAATGILQTAGKDTAALTLDVSRLIARRECKAQMDQRANAERELSAIAMRQATARQAYLDAKQAAEDAFNAADRELNQLEIAQRRIVEAAQAARQRLQGELADSDTKERLTELRNEIDKLQNFRQLNMPLATQERLASLQSEVEALLQAALHVD